MKRNAVAIINKDQHDLTSNSWDMNIVRARKHQSQETRLTSKAMLSTNKLLHSTIMAKI